MGLLADSKSRRRIGADPNNTKWTRDTTTFGQKILRSQGWEPGQYLGVQNSAHSELHTAANASYIRVILKDDMKGLGFAKSKEDEITGLDVFSDLLSRLNGKSEAQVDEDVAARMVVKTNRYVEQRWGAMRFVRGGLLVGDAMKEESDPKEASDSQGTTPEPDGSGEKSKKRKAESLDDSSSESSSDEDEKEKKKRRKEEKKAKKKLSKSTSTEASETEKLKKDKKKKKKSKKDRKAKGETLNESASEEVAESDEKSGSGEDAKKSKKSKKDKKEKKEKKDKKEKKEKKKRKKDGSESQDTEASNAVPSISAVTSGRSTPLPSGTSTPMSNRNFVRSRFIAQKRRVMMDAEAVKQILMIKT
ncbi:Protein PXR1 [Cladobotryum mycophilum]|uniref:PinX1-related protein 1 n=1 Tax=Cladobotryum mycophilum TaxID=491253 RepID=A0ABR0SGN4_9HYPO